MNDHTITDTPEDGPRRSPLAEALAEMDRELATGTPAERPERLPLDALRVNAEVFGLRTGGLEEAHLSDLAHSLKFADDLDPVTVLPCGTVFYLVDGHHRLEAYRRVGRSSIRVRYLEETPKNARARAMKAGGKRTLALSKQDQMTLAWQNLLSGRYSLRAISRMTEASRPQMDIMSRVRKQLGEAAYDYRQWWQAREAARGLAAKPMLSPEEMDAEDENAGRVLADRLRKAMGDVLSRNAKRTAHAFGIILGWKTTEVAELLYRLGYAVEDPEDDECEF